MSEGIFITKTGFRKMKWDSEIRQYVDTPIKSILHELRTCCQIENGVTLRDFINIVAGYEELSHLVGKYSWCDVEAFHKEVNKLTTKKSGLHFIEISRHLSVNKGWESKDDDIEEGLNVSGVGPDSEGTIQNNWAIELTPVNEMADTVVRLDCKFVVRDYRESPPKEIATGETWFSLLEVVTEIFYEISFHGSPENRDEFGKNLLELKEEVMEGVESGEIKLTPWKSDEKIQ